VSPDRPDGVKLVEVATGRIFVLPVSGVHITFPRYWRFSVDGRWFAFAHEKGTLDGIIVWDLNRNQEHAFLNPAYEPFDISPDGAQLISFVGEDPVNSRGVGVWDLATAKQVRHLENPNFPYSDFGYFLTYTPDSNAIVEVSNFAAGPDPRVVVWRWAADSGNRLSAVPPLSDVFVRPHGQVVGTLGKGLGWSQLHLSGTEVQFSPALPINRDDIVTQTPWCPSGRVAAVWPTQWPAPGLATTLAGWATQHRLGWLFPFPKWRVNFYDATSGREIGPLSLPDGPGFKWAPDGSLIACTLPLGKGVEIWDIPPRKPTGWFALLAAILALPFAWLARRRVRRLRSLGGITS
jgi:WD40 repeat protein